MKAILVTCPHCGARLQVVGAAAEVTCEYCGTASRVQRRTQMLQRVLPPPPTAPNRPTLVAVQRKNAVVLWIVIGTILLPIVMAGVIGFAIWRTVDRATSNIRTSTSSQSSQSSHQSATARDVAAEWQGTDGIILTDLDGDGVVDALGRARRVQQNDEVRVIVIDGATGKPRWESEPIGSYSDTHQGKLALAGDLVLFATMRGEVRAFATATGATKWKTALDERVAKLCDGGADTIIAIGSDDVVRPLHRADGTPAAGVAEEPPPAAPPTRRPRRKAAPSCNELPSDDDAYHRDSRELYQLGRDLEISIDKILPSSSGRVLAGNRSKGTRVPILIALDAANALRWKATIPTDPLGSIERSPEAFAVGDQQVCASYYTDSVAKPQRLACFSLADGKRLWDIESRGHSMRFLRITGDQVWVGGVGSLQVLDAATGKPRWSFGE